MKALISRCLSWFDERTGLVTVVSGWASDRLPDGPRWILATGAVAGALLVIQLASGLALALDYSPSVGSAHQSVARIMDPEVSPMGPVMRGLHYYGATFLLLSVVLHGIRLVAFGEHRKPRELMWMTWVAVGGLTLAAALTGTILPWDQNAFHGARVRLGIAQGVPIVGAASADMIRGGAVLGNLSLTRSHALHVTLLPVLILAAMAIYCWLRRRSGPSDSSGQSREGSIRSTRLGQLARSVTVASVVLVILLALAALRGAPHGDIANAARPFAAEPEWFVYWLFQVVHAFEPLQWVGSAVVPGLVVGFLLALPWLDARGQGLKARRGFVGFLALVLAVVGLSLLTARDLAAKRDTPDTDVASVPVTLPLEANPETIRAAMLFGMHCAECHDVDGSPIDPDARDMRTSEFARMAAADFESLVSAVLDGGEVMEGFRETLSPAEARLILREVVLRFPHQAEAGSTVVSLED